MPLESASIAAAAFAENNADALGERQGRKGGAEGQISFDLPAQPLASALEQYSVVSGLQVVYDGTLAEGHESTPVKGNFSPEVALRILLDGTGLSPRYMATDGFVLVPARPDPAADTVSAAAGAQYYGRIQSRLEGALCANDRTRSGGYRIALGIWIAPSGVITRSALLGSSGDTSLDAVIDRMTRGLVIGAPPPPGFAQPVTLLVTPELMRDCQAVQGEGAQP
ncbi:secretin and TonB N-terminal domain-containing protein [Telmatospirillum siberiense]|uniref:secretin and TonB N-terminal domain-containing protein n=1 Tax=Telmatospirillum siberiense TaxID=382514 RepID=UPI001303F418|nr:secretin and TonB N-terminal domain-containing protein [Telmatospirillum siberiense]